ncbi:SRPBCC family protein [Lentilitoribacter sp. EG35]|uniref:SRPBCC family protein n=1 Tax=Lentilitoribacter sp. EG35 TaxID=3234192 RepID=UPI00345FCC2C
MKRFFQFIGFVLLVGIFYLFTQSPNIHEITSEVVIAAPKDKVWAAVTDINSWAENNSAINEASGNVVLGRKLSLTMRGEEAGENGPAYDPTIVELDKGTSYRWRAKMGAELIFTNDKQFELEEVDGGTKLTHTEYFSGMLVPLMLDWFKVGVPPILAEMNAGFKATAEK